MPVERLRIKGKVMTILEPHIHIDRAPEAEKQEKRVDVGKIVDGILQEQGYEHTMYLEDVDDVGKKAFRDALDERLKDLLPRGKAYDLQVALRKYILEGGEVPDIAVPDAEPEEELVLPIPDAKPYKAPPVKEPAKIVVDNFDPEKIMDQIERNPFLSIAKLGEKIGWDSERIEGFLFEMLEDEDETATRWLSKQSPKELNRLSKRIKEY